MTQYEATTHIHYDRTHRKRAAQLKQQEDTCWICGRPINPDLPTNHPHSFTADHVTPIAAGGHKHGQLRAAHRVCNQRRGKQMPTTNMTRHSRQW